MLVAHRTNYTIDPKAVELYFLTAEDIKIKLHKVPKPFEDDGYHFLLNQSDIIKLSKSLESNIVKGEFQIKVKGKIVSMSIMPKILVRCLDPVESIKIETTSIAQSINDREGSTFVTPSPPDASAPTSAYEYTFFCRRAYLDIVLSSEFFRLKGRNFSISLLDENTFSSTANAASLSSAQVDSNQHRILIKIHSSDGSSIPSELDLRNAIYSVEGIVLDLICLPGNTMTFGAFETASYFSTNEFERLADIASIRWSGHAFKLTFAQIPSVSKYGSSSSFQSQVIGPPSASSFLSIDKISSCLDDILKIPKCDSTIGESVAPSLPTIVTSSLDTAAPGTPTVKNKHEYCKYCKKDGHLIQVCPIKPAPQILTPEQEKIAFEVAILFEKFVIETYPNGSNTRQIYLTFQDSPAYRESFQAIKLNKMFITTRCKQLYWSGDMGECYITPKPSMQKDGAILANVNSSTPTPNSKNNIFVDAYHANGLICKYCKQEGHWIEDCPIRPMIQTFTIEEEKIAKKLAEDFQVYVCNNFPSGANPEKIIRGFPLPAEHEDYFTKIKINKKFVLSRCKDLAWIGQGPNRVLGPASINNVASGGSFSSNSEIAFQDSQQFNVTLERTGLLPLEYEEMGKDLAQRFQSFIIRDFPIGRDFGATLNAFRSDKSFKQSDSQFRISKRFIASYCPLLSFEGNLLAPYTFLMKRNNNPNLIKTLNTTASGLPQSPMLLSISEPVLQSSPSSFRTDSREEEPTYLMQKMKELPKGSAPTLFSPLNVDAKPFEASFQTKTWGEGLIPNLSSLYSQSPKVNSSNDSGLSALNDSPSGSSKSLFQVAKSFTPFVPQQQQVIIGNNEILNSLNENNESAAPSVPKSAFSDIGLNFTSFSPSSPAKMNKNPFQIDAVSSSYSSLSAGDGISINTDFLETHATTSSS